MDKMRNYEDEFIIHPLNQQENTGTR